MEHHPYPQQQPPHGGGGGRLNRSESFAYELIVHRGHNLPKADTFGSIDAYLIITPPDNQGYKFTTKTIDNDYNPKWKQTFRWVGPGLDTDTIQVQVWDSDTTSKDDYIGKFTFDASQVPFKKKVFNVQLTSEFENKRKGSGPSTITLSFGVVPTYHTTKARMLSRGGITYPNVIFNDQKETIYINLQPWYLPYYLAVEWEAKDYGRRFDLFLLQTSPEKDLSSAQKLTARWGLPAYPSSFKFKVKKSMELCVTKDILPALSVMQDQGNTIFTAYEEAKLDDLPLYAPLYELQIQYGQKKIEWEGDYAQIGSKHGWKGTLTYEQAKQKLTDKHCDDKHKHVFFVEQQGLFKVDWDSGNSDYQFYLYRAMAQAGITMELSHATQKKKHTQTYMDKSKTLFGQEVVMFASIDDLSYPVQLKDIKATAYKLENQQVLYLATLLPLNPYGF